MYIIRLRLLVQLSMIQSMDHAARHRDGLFKHSIKQTIVAGILQGMDTSFRQGEIDRLRKVQRSRLRISEIYVGISGSEQPNFLDLEIRQRHIKALIGWTCSRGANNC